MTRKLTPQSCLAALSLWRWPMTLQLFCTLLFKVSSGMRRAMLVKRTAPTILVAFPLRFQRALQSTVGKRLCASFAESMWRCIITRSYKSTISHPPVYSSRYLFTSCSRVSAFARRPSHLQPVGLFAQHSQVGWAAEPNRRI